MRCTQCGGRTFVADSRLPGGSSHVRRRRQCRVCGHRMTTYEVVVSEQGGILRAADRSFLRGASTALQQMAENLMRLSTEPGVPLEDEA